MRHYDELGNVIWAHHKQTQAAQNATNMAPSYNANATQERGTLLPAYNSILKNPGYSAADKSAITQSTLGGIGATYGGARDAASNRVARTGNAAGYTAGADDLARSQATSTATAEAGLGEKFADTALTDRNTALSGLSNLYGTDTGTLAKLLQTGTQHSTVDVKAGPVSVGV
jgi:hypothetical protein